jgi:4-hydroxy-3-methylbut-2-en-1-yl diphosphate reductase
LPKKNQCGLIAQTTQSLENLQQVASSLLTRTSTLKVMNTICNATTDLQQETKVLAQSVDVMLVVGGLNSANTSRLAEISKKVGVRTHQIETAKELQADWFKDARQVGVTAGTSTPDWIINEVMEQLSSL